MWQVIVVETSEAHNVAELIARSWNQNWCLLHNWNRDWDELALRLGIPWRSACGLDSIPRKKTTFGFCHTGRQPCRHGWRLNLQNVRGLAGGRKTGVCLFTWTFPLSRFLSQHKISRIPYAQNSFSSLNWVHRYWVTSFLLNSLNNNPYLIHHDCSWAGALHHCYPQLKVTSERQQWQSCMVSRSCIWREDTISKIPRPCKDDLFFILQQSSHNYSLYMLNARRVWGGNNFSFVFWSFNNNTSLTLGLSGMQPWKRIAGGMLRILLRRNRTPQLGPELLRIVWRHMLHVYNKIWS